MLQNLLVQVRADPAPERGPQQDRAARLQPLRQEVLTVLQPEDPHEDPHRGQALQVPARPQCVHCRIHHQAVSTGLAFVLELSTKLRDKDPTETLLVKRTY